MDLIGVSTNARITRPSRPWTVADVAALEAILQLRKRWSEGHRTLIALGFSYRALPDDEEIVRQMARTY